ncbi:TPA: hypothetical protein ACGQLC_001447 [Escherichia coli]|uniref:hypothetical protein n=1 Tax=Enterobacteriaceae TaxID=543 RepID=UPI000DAB0A74|nr:hypothetical protein [Enterobacter asburiae]AWV28203.1 hypothetical protein CD187_19155 [Citrobacter youngae]MCK6994205.1 hypothetical protein [Enterobacter asburiae]
MAFTIGENYAFRDIKKRYKSLKTGEKGLSKGGFLNPSRGNSSTSIRAIFARREAKGPLDNLLFISGDDVFTLKSPMLQEI